MWPENGNLLDPKFTDVVEEEDDSDNESPYAIPSNPNNSQDDDNFNQAFTTDGKDFGPAPLQNCLLYTSPSPRDKRQSRMPSSA